MKKVVFLIVMTMTAKSFAHGGGLCRHVLQSFDFSSFNLSIEQLNSAKDPRKAKRKAREMLAQAASLLQKQGVKFIFVDDLTLQVVPDKSIPGLNRLAYGLDQHLGGMKLKYNPFNLEDSNADAYFDDGENTLYLSHKDIMMDHGEQVLYHELHHGSNHYRVMKTGEILVSVSGLFPGSKDEKNPYAKYVSFDELDSYSYQLVLLARQINKLTPQQKQNLWVEGTPENEKLSFLRVWTDSATVPLQSMKNTLALHDVVDEFAKLDKALATLSWNKDADDQSLKITKRLSKGTFEMIKNKDHYELTFNRDGNSMEFEIWTQNSVQALDASFANLKKNLSTSDLQTMNTQNFIESSDAEIKKILASEIRDTQQWMQMLRDQVQNFSVQLTLILEAIDSHDIDKASKLISQLRYDFQTAKMEFKKKP